MADREHLQYRGSHSFANKSSSMILVMIWWFVSAHKWFKGPKINVRPPYLFSNRGL
jgi:hypothetical protein